jgi:hypothetical protein
MVIGVSGALSAVAPKARTVYDIVFLLLGFEIEADLVAIRHNALAHSYPAYPHHFAVSVIPVETIAADLALKEANIVALDRKSVV